MKRHTIKKQKLHHKKKTQHHKKIQLKSKKLIGGVNNSSYNGFMSAYINDHYRHLSNKSITNKFANNNSSEIKLPYILHKFDYFCWDFDDTIAHNEQGRTHLSLDLEKAEQLTGEQLFHEYFYDAENLIKLMIYLKQKKKYIFIISFGDPSVIVDLLNKLFVYYYDINGFTHDFKPPFVVNETVFGLYNARVKESNAERVKKNEQMKNRKVDTMELIIKQTKNEQKKNGEKKIEKKKILFFDDDYRNTQAMNKNNISAITIPGHKTRSLPQYQPQDQLQGFNLDILKKLERDIRKRILQPSQYIIEEDYLFESFEKKYRKLTSKNHNKIRRNEALLEKEYYNHHNIYR